MTSQALNRPVDVLRVLDAEIMSLTMLSGKYAAENLIEARAAVAELIEAASELVEVSKFASMMDFLPTPANANGPLPRTIAALAAIEVTP